MQPRSCDDPPGSRLFVVCGKAAEKNVLLSAFRAFGNVQAVKLVREKGVAFVKFDKASSAALAMEQLNGCVLDNGRGPRVKVLLAEALQLGPVSRHAPEQQFPLPDDTPPRSRLFIVVPKTADGHAITEEMRKYGNLQYCKTNLIASKGIVFCKYYRASSALKALEDVSSSGTLLGYRVRCMLAEPKGQRLQEELGRSLMTAPPGPWTSDLWLGDGADVSPHAAQGGVLEPAQRLALATLLASKLQDPASAAFLDSKVAPEQPSDALLHHGLSSPPGSLPLQLALAGLTAQDYASAALQRAMVSAAPPAWAALQGAGISPLDLGTAAAAQNGRMHQLSPPMVAALQMDARDQYNLAAQLRPQLTHVLHPQLGLSLDQSQEHLLQLLNTLPRMGATADVEVVSSMAKGLRALQLSEPESSMTPASLLTAFSHANGSGPGGMIMPASHGMVASSGLAATSHMDHRTALQVDMLAGTGLLNELNSGHECLNLPRKLTTSPTGLPSASLNELGEVHGATDGLAAAQCGPESLMMMPSSLPCC